MRGSLYSSSQGLTSLWRERATFRNIAVDIWQKTMWDKRVCVCVCTACYLPLSSSRVQAIITESVSDRRVTVLPGAMRVLNRLREHEKDGAWRERVSIWRWIRRVWSHWPSCDQEAKKYSWLRLKCALAAPPGWRL